MKMKKLLVWTAVIAVVCYVSREIFLAMSPESKQMTIFLGMLAISGLYKMRGTILGSALLSQSQSSRDRTQWIRDIGGGQIGRVEEAGDNQLFGFDQLGNPVGRYNPIGDMTYDKHGNMVGRGNMLSGLIMQAK
jgi:hypothetical protein